MPDLAIAPGDVLAGKYRIEKRLGAGGMGYVLGAHHLQLDERVAIKILHPDAARDGESVARFFREARAASRIKGEHVVRVLDVGSLPDATPFIVMEHLDGCDLASLIEQQGPLPVGLTVDYVLQACEALAEAHAVGIVHRDVKPSNLFLTTRNDGTPCVKVLDFGISKAMSPVDETRPDFGMTRTQSVLGSPQYMAPEQMRSSRRVDGRTDIWAIGTIVHELLTGQAPFVANTMPELFAMILTDPTPSLRNTRPDVPEELDRAVARCLEKDPDRRYPTVLDVATALAPFGTAASAGTIERIARVTQKAASTSGRGSAPSIGGAPSPASSSSSNPLSLAKTTVDPDHPEPPPRGLRVWLVAGGFAGLALVGGTLTFLALSHRPAAPSAVDPARDEVSAATTPVSAVASAAPPEPVASASASASASAAPAPSASASVATRPTTRTSSPRASSKPVGGPAPTASAAPAVTKPTTTATSRYD